MGSKSSPPPAPDYSGAARQTALSQMNSQYTPYGNNIYSPDASSPSGYRSSIYLAPQAQNTLDTQMNLSNQMAGLTSSAMGNINQMPMDQSSVQQTADKAYGAMTARLDPQWQQNTAAEGNKLANQGIMPGSEAYNNEMRTFNQAKNDAYQQANLGAISTMPQTYQLATSQFNQPLNYANALRTGAQITNPQFTSQPGANYLGAAQATGQYNQGLYNANIGQQNSMMSGLFDLGSAATPFLLNKYG